MHVDVASDVTDDVTDLRVGCKRMGQVRSDLNQLDLILMWADLYWVSRIEYLI